MFGKNKDNSAGKDQAAAPSYAARISGPEQPARTAENISCISSGMTIVGKMIGDGTVKIFGRVEGELQASSILICDGAQVEGNIVAQELTVGGRVKGTVHAIRVTLQGTAVVEGDIFHRSLAVEENARFEGTSRREDNLPDKPSSAQVKGLSPPSQAQPLALIDGKGTFKDKPDNQELHSAN
jgi:cytoskeletal protein CcmA (bactofilin family)